MLSRRPPRGSERRTVRGRSFLHAVRVSPAAPPRPADRPAARAGQGEYQEERRNCQTFAADLFGFLSGRKGVEPYHAVCRVLYKPRPFLFLYDPDSD